MPNPYNSGIYIGKVRHRRFTPVEHLFTYQLFMVYFNTLEIDKICATSKLWSSKPWSLAQFKRTDFHINQDDDPLHPALSLDNSIRKTVFEKSKIQLKGPIRALGNWRYFGINMNPITTYYCFNEEDTHVVALLIEVNNTPWNERVSYVISTNQASKKMQCQFHKEMHVSPFNPIDMIYDWQSTTPNKTLAIHIENWSDHQKITDATLSLRHEPITPEILRNILIQFPFMTVKVVFAIYWQALKLWLKKAPLFDHPKKQPTINSESAS